MGRQVESGWAASTPFEIQAGLSNRFEHMPFRWQITLEQLQRWDLSYYNPNGLQTDPLTGEALDQELNFGQMLCATWSLALSSDRPDPSISLWAIVLGEEQKCVC